MTGQTYKRQWERWIAAFFMLCLFAAPALAATPQLKRQQARSQFEIAERMREELNGLPQHDRTRREYQRVMDAYRRVYYTSPASSKADASVVAVAELLAESGRSFNDVKSLRGAIAQYEFLRREYPGSKYRFDALFTIGQIYKDDLEEMDKARDTFQEVIRRYPHLQLSADAREAIVEMDSQPRGKQKSRSAKAKPQESLPRQAKDSAAPESRSPDARTPDTRTPDARASEPRPDIKTQESKTQDSKSQDAKPQEVSADAARTTYPLVTGIRHWSTPDYTRVAIDLEQEVKYEAGRVPNPDRIFFDLHDTKLASTLVGKTFEVSDGFLRRVRIAQFHKGMVRVVLEVDDVSDYSAFLLPNPYRLIVDIHGRKPNTPQTLVARAQQQEEIKAGTSSTPPETKPEKPAVAPFSAPLPSKVPTSADTKPSKLPAVTSPAPESSRSTSEYGPRLADGSFVSPTPSAAAAQESTNAEVANMKGSELKATDKPTSEPTVQVVAPRAEKKTLATAKKNQRYPEIHQAQPSADGQRSLIRALGLKVGRIVIDAGHGGHDTGTIGPNGLLEKNLVLDVALRLGKLLKGKMGADVIYTRDDDTFIPLETRTAIANQQQADLFISVHANSSQDPSARGVETYYLNFNPSPDALEVAARENAVSEKSVHELGDLVKKIALKEKVDESREFAADVQYSLYQGLAGKEKTLRNRGVKKAPFIVLIGANMPSILAEISFVSNPGDERRLQTPEYRQRIAESLYKGVSRYINGLSGVKLATKVGAGEGEQ